MQQQMRQTRRDRVYEACKSRKTFRAVVNTDSTQTDSQNRTDTSHVYTQASSTDSTENRIDRHKSCIGFDWILDELVG